MDGVTREHNRSCYGIDIVVALRILNIMALDSG